jgi:hypothetical protein
MEKYLPLSEGEFLELKEHLAGIKAFLPEHLMGPFWSWCNRIRGRKENQPCGCKSAAKHWGQCVSDLRDYVKRVEEQK